MRQRHLPHRRPRTPAPRSTVRHEDRYAAHLLALLHKVYQAALQRVEDLGLHGDAEKGEGSRGGHIIGHTKSGEPIYGAPADRPGPKMRTAALKTPKMVKLSLADHDVIKRFTQEATWDRPTAEELQGVLDKLPISNLEKQHRGEALSDFSLAQLQMASKEGGFWQSDYHASFSVDRGTAEGFARNSTGPGAWNATVFTIEGPSQGRDISMYSNKPGEQELLHPPKSKYKVKSVRKRGEYHHVHLYQEKSHTDADGFEPVAYLFRALRLAYFEQERPEMAQARVALQQIAHAVDGQNSTHIQEIMRRVLNVNPVLTEPWLKGLMEGWTTANVSLVTSVGTEMLSDLEQTIYRTVQGEQSRKELQAALEQQYQLSRNRAKLIARDQVSKLNGQLTRERQTRLGVTGYWWRDSKDVRVRQMHRQLARASDRGKIYQWDDPPVTNKAGDHNHPGGDYQCRCWADPVIPGVDK